MEDEVKVDVQRKVDNRTDLEKARASSFLILELLGNRIIERISEAREDSGADALKVERYHFSAFSDLTKAYEQLKELKAEVFGLMGDIRRMSSVVSVNAVNARVWEISVELTNIY